MTTALLALLACSGPEPSPLPPPPPSAPPTPSAGTVPPAGACTILAINDTYRMEPLADGTGGMARVRTARAQLEAAGSPVVLLHAGDFLAPSLLSRTYGGDQMIEAMSALDGDTAAFDPRMVVVFGNHEFDASKLEDAPGLTRRIAASQFTWLGTNVEFAAGADGKPLVSGEHLVDTYVVDCGALKLGVFGVTTDAKKPKYVERFEDPAATARASVAALRTAGADVVVGLTHQTLDADEALLRTLGADGPDLIVGGHEHDNQRRDVGPRAVFKADADAHTAWQLRVWREADGPPRFDAKLLPLDATVPEDPAVKALVDARLAQHDQEFCTKAGKSAGCLSAEVGRSTTSLVAAELEIRRFETNLGNWVADQALAAFPGAQVALINSGSLRLNRDLAPGPITRQDIEELFAYPTPLVKMEIDGATLQAALGRAVSEWSGNGHWLQVAGVAWVHDPAATTASRATLLATGRRISATDRITLVVPAFLADPAMGQDGYTMLPATPAAKDAPDLKQLVLEALGRGAIGPVVEGRICNTTRPGPCLAAQ